MSDGKDDGGFEKIRLTLMFNNSDPYREKGIQLSRVRFWDQDGQEMDIVAAEARYSEKFSPEALIDEDHLNKWVDMKFTTDYKGVLLFTTANQNKAISKYDLYTADEPRSRDPTLWILEVEKHGRWIQIDNRDVSTPPPARWTCYGGFTPQ